MGDIDTPAWRIDARVATCALVLFAPTIVQLNVRVTDLSAWRVLQGDVLYRDMWTMYAPGSIYFMALAYAIFGRHMIVGNALGALTSTAAVGAFHRLASWVTSPRAAIVVAAVFAFGFLGSGYQNSFGSYAPAILLLLLAFDRLAAHAASRKPSDLRIAGLLLGVGAVFKHDVALYGCVAATVGIVATPAPSWGARVRDVTTLAMLVVGSVAIPVGLLVLAGAGPAMVEDLLIFPRTYFPVVRPEGFRVLPPWGAHWRGLWWWLDLNAPSWALLIGLPGALLGWRGMNASAQRVIAMSLAVFVLFWLAAHIQANTHRVSMSGFGALICAAGLFGSRSGTTKPAVWARRIIVLAAPAWCLAMLAPWGARIYQSGLEAELVWLPRLEGIVMPRWQADQLRELEATLREAGHADAPILQVGRRNDVLIFAGATPYWVTDRRMVTPYHELHPGVTDIEVGQTRMLEALAGGPFPVVVREHRFDDAALDRWGERYRAGGVPVGATLLDTWVETYYEPWRRIGAHEVMRLRGDALSKGGRVE
jgi:hypothetical protein